MSPDRKNPHLQDTPEWQLWENMTSAERLERSYTEDSERYLKMAAAAREKADRFKAALAKLGAA